MTDVLATKRVPDAAAEVLTLSDVLFSWPGPGAFSLAIDGLKVPKGERLLIMGPSGAGKSTLLSLICGIVHPSAGRIVVAGTDIAHLRGAACDRFRADHFGIIFQMFNLLPYGTIMDNILLPLSFAPARRQRARERGAIVDEVQRLMNRLGLEPELQDQQAVKISVGQQQRVAVARALIGNPDIVIADEPTSSLDRDRQADFLALLFEEVEHAGSTLIMVSHDETLAREFDRTVSLDTLVQAGRGATC